MAKLVPLTQGKFAIVSDEDWWNLMRQKWCAKQNPDGRWYACGEVDGKFILMHRYIMKAPPDKDVDHINNDGINNARYNLRVVSRSANLSHKVGNRLGLVVPYNYEPDPVVHDKTIIPLLGGDYTVVDEEDWDWLYPTRWYLGISVNDRPVVVRGIKGGRIYIHREIMSKRLGRPLLREEFVDHIDGNPKNNHSANLRLSTNQQNCCNRKTNKNNSSGYKGVNFHKGRQKWVAQIGYKWKRICIGYFDTPLEAALAYDTKAIELFGAFARPNFPRSP